MAAIAFVLSGYNNNHGWAYDGEKFLNARKDDRLTRSGQWSDDGMREEYSRIGWVTLGETQPEDIPSEIREYLIAEWKKKDDAERDRAAKLQAFCRDDSWKKEWERQKAEKAAQKAAYEADILTIGGKTYHLDMWRTGLSVLQEPAPEEYALMQERGLKCNEKVIWRISGDQTKNDPQIELGGRSYPRNYMAEGMTIHELPNGKDLQALKDAKLFITESKMWVINDPQAI